MRDGAITEAERLARRFLDAAKAERKARTPYQTNGHTFTYTSPKHRGALRRVSMDLTRALAEMRKPG